MDHGIDPLHVKNGQVVWNKKDKKSTSRTDQEYLGFTSLTHYE